MQPGAKLPFLNKLLTSINHVTYAGSYCIHGKIPMHSAVQMVVGWDKKSL
jgi:hypothetical protein